MPSNSITFLLIMCLIALSNQAPASKSCTAVPNADVDNAWLDKTFETGFEVGIGCKLEPQLSVPKPQPEGKAMKKKKCYMLTMNLKFGSFQVPCTCKYDKLNEQYCDLKTEGSTVQQAFNFHGRVHITKTNNQTYFVAYICLGAKEKYWNAYVPSGHVLDGDTIGEIKAHVATLGFGTEDKDLRTPGEDTISHTMIRKVDCNALNAVHNVKDAQNLDQSKVDVPGTNGINKDDKSKSRMAMFEDVLKLLDSPLTAFNPNKDKNKDI